MDHLVTLRYHQAALQLINEAPLVSDEAVGVLDQFELRHHIILPASLREWYSLKRGVKLLNEFGSDRAVDLAHLGGAEKYWSGGKEHEIDLLPKRLIPIIRENQGVCTWAVHLDGSEDPPVVLSFNELLPSAVWEPYADTFSIFVYTRIWDFRGILGDMTIFGWKQELLATELAFLRSHFQEGPQTYTYPGVFNYRFHQDGQYILIHEREQQTSWYLFADSEQKLLELEKTIKQCSTLEKDLYVERDGLDDWH